MDSGAELHRISSEAEGPVGGEVAAHGTPTSTLSTIESSQSADSHDLAVLNIEVIDRAIGQHDEGSPPMLPEDPFLRGAVNGLDGTAVTGWIECIAPDTGEFAIPAELVSELIDMGLSGFPRAEIERRSSATLDLDSGCVEFHISSKVTLEIALEGLDSCNEDAACDSGQSCNDEKVCE